MRRPMWSCWVLGLVAMWMEGGEEATTCETATSMLYPLDSLIRRAGRADASLDQGGRAFSQAGLSHSGAAALCAVAKCQLRVRDAGHISCLRGGSLEESYSSDSLQDSSGSHSQATELFRQMDAKEREDKAREEFKSRLAKNGTDVEKLIAYGLMGDGDTPHSIDFTAGFRYFPGLEHFPPHPREATMGTNVDDKAQPYKDFVDLILKPENLPILKEAVKDSVTDTYNKFFNKTRIEEKKLQRQEKEKNLINSIKKKKLNYNWLNTPARDMKMEYWVQMDEWKLKKRARLALEQYHKKSPSVLFNLTYVMEGEDEDSRMQRFMLSFFSLEEAYEGCRRARDLFYGPKLNELDQNLLTAAMDGDWRQVAFWIRRGADVHARDLKLGSNWTSLHHAAFSGFSVTSRTLVELGADLYAREPSFLDTPLHFAAAQGHTKCVKTLVGLGCPVDITNGDGRTPLHEAAGRGQTDTCAALIELGADVNIRYRGDEELWGLYDAWTNTGATALHDAAEKGYDATCKLLLQKGARLHALDSCMCTPLDRTEYHMIQEDLMDVCYQTHKLLKGWDDGSMRDYTSEVARSPGEDELDKLLHADAGSFSLNFEWTDALNYNGIAINALDRARNSEFYSMLDFHRFRCPLAHLWWQRTTETEGYACELSEKTAGETISAFRGGDQPGARHQLREHV